MRPNPIPLIAALFLLPILSLAQTPVSYTIRLRSGSFIPSPNIDSASLNAIDQRSGRANGKSYALLQFENIPSESMKKEMSAAGIELLDYVPNYAYTVSCTGHPDAALLRRCNARAWVEMAPAQKMDARLMEKMTGTAEVWVSYPRTFDFSEVKQILLARNFSILETLLKDHHILKLSVSARRLEELASLPCIDYVQQAPGPMQELNAAWTQYGRDNVRTSVLNAPVSLGGKDLNGQGVVIGVGDNSDPQQHPDFTGRIISRAAAPYNYHGTHVTGIAAGAGIRNELRRGAAPKATILSQAFSNIFTFAPGYVSDFGMVITNNSYGNNVSDCNSFGTYDLYSRILDQQAFDLPSLQHFFAAGNSGPLTCPPFATGYRTVLGGMQSAKNVVSVGNATGFGTIFFGSSRGPARDGRIKPEIITVGTDVTSTAPAPPFDYYFANTGTSMASPSAAGGLSLLYEKYRQLNGGTNPKNGLMKALLCNGADDWGNPGPDYIHGFGMANFWRSEQMLENGNYVIDNISPGPDKTVTVNVPANTAQLKVMLYWNDPAAAAVASQSLVNDLDLAVETPSATTVLPYILDTVAAYVGNNATRGADHINNIEQVVISNPDPGSYTLRVKATNITQNPSQEYFLVYDFVPVETKLITPFAGEKYVHGESVEVLWDSYGDPQNTFTLEFSSDDGTNWTTLSSSIASDQRRYFVSGPPNEWRVPEVTTDQARMRITRNGTGLISLSGRFIIHDTMTVTLDPVQCEGYITIDWNAVSGATGYQVMLLQGTEMVPVATLNNSTFTYTLSGLSRDTTYWVSVRPLIGVANTPGRRGIAVSRRPNSGTCSGTISDNDIRLDSLISPAGNGRLYTSSALSSSQVISIRIKNLDDNTTPGTITVGYKLDAAPAVTETITPNISGGGTYQHNFAVTADLSAAGTHVLKTFVNQSGDPVAANDTLVVTISQLDNPLITGIDFPAVLADNFDAAPVQSFTTRTIGLTALDKFDFVPASGLGRIRSFVNSGIAYSGNRALTLDTWVYTGATIVDSLTATYNLSGYNANTDDIRLDFRYKNHGQGNNAANRVWIRGDDTKPWVQVYDLYANQNPADGSYKYTGAIELNDLLLASSQNYSSSFQVRWGEACLYQAADDWSGGGYTFDDVRIFRVVDDIQMVSIDTPIVNSCGLGINTPVGITLRNSSNAAIPASPGIPVRYRVNGGSWVNETVAGLAANTSLPYIFSTRANMSAPGTYTLEVQVLYPTDNYPANDTLSLTLVNTPVITVTNSSPSLEDFENGNGSWYSGGTYSSWQYGTPASYKIRRAASGNKAWKTSLAGTYNDLEESYLYSPCYNISALTNPYLSFSVALDLEDCGGSLCDAAYLEYSVDGRTWARLGASGQGTNWYNKAYSGNNCWSIQDYTRWHVASIPLSVIPVPTAQLTSLRFRFVMKADFSLDREGIAIDDIHVYNNSNAIYAGTGASAVSNQPVVNGSSWINFIDAGSNKIIAAINPNNTDLGSTDVQSYGWTGAIRISSGQYYHNRNITIKPATVALADSAAVRFYFTDAETETLINATGCSSCSKPAMFCELGVTKYSDPDDSRENGTLSDNNPVPAYYSFIRSTRVRMVPYDVGYYAEFKVKDFSEFWLNNGGLNANTPLPVKLISFTARKQPNKDVLLTWKATEEQDLLYYEVELARGNADYRQQLFSSLGRVNAVGAITTEQEYNLTDNENNKTGVRYYRLRMVDRDGTVRYSAIRPVEFSDELPWQVYPNPSSGVFQFLFQLPEGQALQLRVYDASGRVVKEMGVNSSGFPQKLLIDLSGRQLPAGVYMLEAGAEGQKKYFRMIRQ